MITRAPRLKEKMFRDEKCDGVSILLFYSTELKKNCQNSGELLNFIISFLKKQLANFINCILRSIANVMQAYGFTDSDDIFAKLLKSHLELAKKTGRTRS
ncbi:hypothetical protein [Microcoleus sp. PH2017_28_MFU_U_A]|uniref:hypothetical protein n=1 Tax=Microcoleus sp. PH2017_28_MFU_U_A TaxID=2798838 RepID=UPI002D7F2790|nr:hypothetical protein [Microcoleus sp. PH2017_28_MFU_U_A]